MPEVFRLPDKGIDTEARTSPEGRSPVLGLYSELVRPPLLVSLALSALSSVDTPRPPLRGHFVDRLNFSVFGLSSQLRVSSRSSSRRRSAPATVDAARRSVGPCRRLPTDCICRRVPLRAELCAFRVRGDNLVSPGNRMTFRGVPSRGSQEVAGPRLRPGFHSHVGHSNLPSRHDFRFRDAISLCGDPRSRRRRRRMGEEPVRTS